MTTNITFTNKVESNTVWRITVDTKHGTDVILVRQDKEPTAEELTAIEDRFKHDYDLEDVYADHAGSIDFANIPLGVEKYLEGDYA